jgi:hypothetical protein
VPIAAVLLLLSQTVLVDEPGEQVSPPKRSEATAPPEIRSTRPSPGQRDLPANTTFEIRFTADMDETSFEGNVLLRIGDIGSESTSLVPAVSTYDSKSKTLTLAPVEPLPLLKEISLSFHRGVLGADGQPLRVEARAPKSIQSRRSAVKQGADLNELMVLRFFTRGY